MEIQYTVYTYNNNNLINIINCYSYIRACDNINEITIANKRRIKRFKI